MAFSLSRRGQFIAWVVLYGGAVWLMMKGDERLVNLIWGMAFGVGAAIAACGIRVANFQRRLTMISVWFLACWLLGLILNWSEYGPKAGTTQERLQTSVLVTLIPAFPALLALIVWLFKRPKPSESQTTLA